MKRIIKNILMIIFVVAIILGIVFTIRNSKQEVVEINKKNSQTTIKEETTTEDAELEKESENKEGTEEEFLKDFGGNSSYEENDSFVGFGSSLSKEKPPAEEKTEKIKEEKVAQASTPTAKKESNSTGTLKNKLMIQKILFVVGILLVILIIIYMISSKGNQYQLKKTLDVMNKNYFASSKKVFLVLKIVIVVMMVTSAVLSALLIYDLVVGKPTNVAVKGTEAEQSGFDIKLAGAYEISSDENIDKKEVISTKGDEIGVYVKAGKVTSKDMKIIKEGDITKVDNKVFFGNNATLYVAEDGKIELNGGMITSSGVGAPLIYSLSPSVAIDKTTMVTRSSQAMVLDGESKASISNAMIASACTDTIGKCNKSASILIYNSEISGKKVGCTSLEIKDSTIDSMSESMIHVSNNNADIELSGNKIKLSSDRKLLTVERGEVGKNKSEVRFVLNKQAVIGDVYADKYTILSVNITNGSAYVGAINKDNIHADITLNIDETSKVKLTGDIYVTKFKNTKKDNSNINFNGHKIYVNGQPLV